MLKKLPIVVYALVPILLFLYFVVRSEDKNLFDIYQDVSEEPQQERTVPGPSVESIFSDEHSRVATFSAGRVRTLIATGDVIPARTVNAQTIQRNNFLWPYEATAGVLKNGDVTFINLEAPLIENCPITNSGFLFCGDERHIQGLTSAGVDIANLANNHAGNYGQSGIDATIALLQENNIDVTGVGSYTVLNVKGMKFAFLGYDDLKRQGQITDEYKETITQDIQEAVKNAQVVVVQFHWGVEYVEQPTRDQQALGRLAIDAGADVVIGNHPHWIQPVEVYKEKVIAYSHGNFIFDQMWSLATRQGVVGKYTFLDDKLIDVEFLPIQIEDYGQPHFLTGEEKTAILERMQNASLQLTDR